MLVVHGLPRACGRSQGCRANRHSLAGAFASHYPKQTALARSRLYRLFEWSAGVTYDIPRQRMLEAPSTLSNPANDRPIKAIVEHVDFSDATGFSQSVKNSLGDSSDEARGECAVSFQATAGSMPREQAKATELGMSVVVCLRDRSSAPVHSRSC